MAIIPRKPFSEIESFFEDWFPSFIRNRGQEPFIDVYETDKEIVAEADVPGFDPDRIDISVKNGVLTIRGEREEKKEDDKKNYWRKEIKRDSFERMIRLPSEVNEDSIDAEYDKGALKIKMEKLEEKKPEKKIKIRKA